MNFVILATPRSRTAWLSRFLAYGDWVCGHDEIKHLRALSDISSWFKQENVGTVETAGAPWWRVIPEGVRIVTIRRPVEDAVESFMRLGIAGFSRDAVAHRFGRLNQYLDQVERRREGVISVQYADLGDEGHCAALFETCLPYKHHHSRWAALSRENVQINVRALLRYYEAHKPQIDLLASQVKHVCLSKITHRPPEISGMTIQQEDLETLLSDGTHLFADHSVEVGEAPDSYLSKNLPLIRKLDELGFILITTARCNGRMFGYLGVVISPSLESEGTTIALNQLFYVSKDAPGLGLRLQRASAEALRERGVDEVYMRAGIRGAGARISSIYKRLGAESFGELYKLNMRNE